MPQKMHRDCSAEVHVLQTKTIEGALLLFSHYKPANAPQVIALQVISNSLESKLDPNVVMAQMVELVSIISYHCPDTQLVVGVPLPRICLSPDITSRYDVCRDLVENSLKGLAEKRRKVSVVLSPDLDSHNKSFFHDNKYLCHQSHNGSTTGLGLLIRAYKSIIYPMMHHGGYERSQYETRKSKYRPNSSYQRNHCGWNPSGPYSSFWPHYYRNYPNQRCKNHTAEYPPRDTHPLTSYSLRTHLQATLGEGNTNPINIMKQRRSIPYLPRNTATTTDTCTTSNLVWLSTWSVVLYNEVLLKILPIYVCILKWTFNVTENRECCAHTDDVWLCHGWRHQGLSLWQPKVSSEASGLASCISWFSVTWSLLMQRYMVICVFFWLTFLCWNLTTNCEIITWSIQGGKSILVSLELFTVYHNLCVFLCVFLSMLTACVPKCVIVDVEFHHCPCHSYHYLYIGDNSDNDSFVMILGGHTTYTTVLVEN